MASKYDSIRNRRTEGEAARERVLARAAGGSNKGETKAPTSRFDAIRNRTSNLSVGDTARTNETYTARQNANEQRLGGGATAPTRPAESASARAMHEKRLEQNEPAPSVQPDFLKPQAKAGTYDAIREFRKNTPVVDEPGINERLGEKLREVPVLGSVLRGLDKVQKFTEPAANIAQEYYTPGAGLGALASAEKGAVNLAGKLLPKAAPIVQKVIAEAGIGGVTGAGQSLAAHPEEGFKGAAVSGGIGAAGGAALPVLGTGIRKGFQAIKGAGTKSIPTVEKSNDTWFNRLFGSSNLGIKAGSNVTRTGTGSQIVDNPLKRDAQGVLDKAKETGRAINQNYVDFTAPLEHLGGDVREVALDSRRANNLANTIIKDKFVNPEGEVIGASLKDVIGAVPRGQGDAFEDYLIVRHAKTRVGRGEKVYEDRLEFNDVPKLEARQAELERRYPEFKRLGDEWDAYNTRLLDEGQNFGLISEAQKTAMREQNPNYASMRRQFSTSEKYANAVRAKEGFSGQKAPIKEVSPTGSARKIVSPIRSAIEQTGAWMNAGLRNRVMQSILKRIEADPESMKGIVEVIPDHMHQKSLKEINEALADGGVDGLSELLDNEFKAAFVKGKGGKTDNIVTAMVDGNPVKMRVLNPEIFKALQGTSPQDVGVVVATARALSNATKRGATGALAPLFAAKGATTDIAQALIQAKNPFTHAGNLVHAVVSSLADTLPKGTPGFEAIRSLAQDFKRTGGEYSAALRGDRALNRSVGALKREPILSPKGIAKGTVAAVKAPFRALEGVSDIAENINRVAAYKSELNRLGGERTPENIRKALRESQEITTNFSRKGAKADEIEAFIPYSNAAIQGLRRFGQAWKKNPIKTAAAVSTLVILPKIWETAKFSYDPDYQKLPARTRYRNLILHKNDDGTFVQLPMPPEYEAIGAVTGSMMDKIKGDNPDVFKGSADAIVNAYTPPFVSGALQGATQGGGLDQSVFGALGSTVAGPISGYTGNQSFTGAPIVPERLQKNSPYLQTDERTSSVADWLASTSVGKALKLSPLKTDYLLKQYGGDLARLGLPLTSDFGGGTPSQTLLRNFVVDPVFTNNLSRDFYDKVDKVTQIVTDVGDGAEAPNWLTDEVKKLATSRAKDTPLKLLSELGTEKRAIQGDKSLNAGEKAVKLRENQRKINEIYLDVSSQLDSLGVK